MQTELTVHQWSLRDAWRPWYVILTSFNEPTLDGAVRSTDQPIAYLRSPESAQLVLIDVQQAWHVGRFAFLRLEGFFDRSGRPSRRVRALTVLLLGAAEDMAVCKRWLNHRRSTSRSQVYQGPSHVH
ncbi:hypothetical protein NQT62_05675 [Limnobacter humi]|uniref:NusG-like N-terminal domain-containing protein n=1 Tax=Limnobacter humi TaxID=1778671 RepID=A0ABT1WGQ2_9BURK|nr:hypothetical protein [Limnobacter humi]MCQ8895927.1 hypothetical protein [Limnobacter humi]